MPNDFSRAASIAACVDLPVPSPPSNVMKRPRIVLLFCESLRLAARRRASDASTYSRLAAERNRPITSSAAASKARCEVEPTVDAFGRLQRHLQDLGVAAPDLQLADRLALPHRRPHRPDIDHLGGNPLAAAARHHQLDRPLGDDRDLALRAAVDLGLGDGLAFGEQQPGVEALEPPFQQLPALVRAVFLRSSGR